MERTNRDRDRDGLPELGLLSDDSVSLIRVETSRSGQETFLVGEDRLQIFVRQTRPVLWVDERVTAAVQSHLTVDLRIRVTHLGKSLFSLNSTGAVTS